MNINSWLQTLDNTDKNTPYSNMVNDLFSLYIRGIHEIYQIDKTNNKSDFIKKVTSRINLKSEKMFISWLEKNGFQEMEQILNLNIRLDESVKSKISLMKYSMTKELDWPEKSVKSLRPAIMNGIIGLKDELEMLANAAKEKNALSIDIPNRILVPENTSDFMVAYGKEVSHLDIDKLFNSLYNGNTETTINQNSCFYF